MREILELRLWGNRAQALVGNRGQSMGRGLLRRVSLELNDPAIERIKDAQAEARRKDQSVFSYWNVKRTYSTAELDAAELIQILPNAMFGPAGEECGTRYDYSDACVSCGAGRQQTSDLKIRVSRIPATADLAFSIARDELVVSQRLGHLIESERLGGASLLPVRFGRGAGVVTEHWRQLGFRSKAVEAVDPSTFGASPLDDHVGVCPFGHVLGNRILSELTVSRNSWDGSDLARTRQLVGQRRGLIAPYPLLLISQRCYKLLRTEGVKGFSPEVAHII